jgi:hypothetical protein
MTPEQKELFRLAILKVMDANNTRFGLGVAAICHLLVAFGFPNAKPEDVEEELDYLCRKELATEVLKIVSRENKAWRITKAGIQFLDARS